MIPTIDWTDNLVYAITVCSGSSILYITVIPGVYFYGNRRMNPVVITEIIWFSDYRLRYNLSGWYYMVRE